MQALRCTVKVTMGENEEKYIDVYQHEVHCLAADHGHANVEVMGYAAVSTEIDQGVEEKRCMTKYGAKFNGFNEDGVTSHTPDVEPMPEDSKPEPDDEDDEDES